MSHAAAKSLQSCLTLCDPIDSSPPGSAIPGILQARTLEWVAISLNNMNLANKSMEKIHYIDDRRDYFSTGTVIKVRETYGYFIIDIKRVRVNLPIIDQKKKKKWQRLGMRMLTTQIQILPIKFPYKFKYSLTSSYVSSPTKQFFFSSIFLTK